MIEITKFTKTGGPLTKHIALDANGKPDSDASACYMARGSAQRLTVGSVDDLAAVIERLGTAQAIALGAMRPDLNDEVNIVTKKQLNGGEGPGLIARTDTAIRYREGQPAFVLFDHDQKGMPGDVRSRLDAQSGFWNALAAIIPELRGAALVIRASTSAGIYRTDTGEKFPGSGGLHAYVMARDGADTQRFLDAVHDRCWLAGLGWHWIDAAGKLQERSIIDRSVGKPERLVFEGPPVFDGVLSQDLEARRPVVTAGEAIDTFVACPPLSAAEKQTVSRLKAEDKRHMQPAARKVRAEYVANHATKLVARTGMTLDAAKHVIEKQCDGLLLSDVELALDALDDHDMSAGTRTVTVGDALDDPTTFEGWTLGDPMGGKAKATILLQADGTPQIFSWEHGAERITS